MSVAYLTLYLYGFSMPPTLVNVAVGALLGAALLGAAFDRRSVLLVSLAAALPDVDAAVSLLVQGATNAVLHNVFVPAAVAAGLYWDTSIRETSWVRERYGWWGVRVAWVALASFAVAGIGADFFAPEAVNLLWPVHDRFYVVAGRLGYSTHDGLIQSYVGIDAGWLLPLESPGTTTTHHVETWLNPTPGTDTAPDVERRLRVVDDGWQAVLVATSAAVVTIRFREDP